MLFRSRVERLDLARFEFLVESAVIETRLALTGLNEAFDDDENGDHRQDDEDDGPEVFAHFVVRLPYASNRNL